LSSQSRVLEREARRKGFCAPRRLVATFPITRRDRLTAWVNTTKDLYPFNKSPGRRGPLLYCVGPSLELFARPGANAVGRSVFPWVRGLEHPQQSVPVTSPCTTVTCAYPSLQRKLRPAVGTRVKVFQPHGTWTLEAAQCGPIEHEQLFPCQKRIGGQVEPR
jgi:hypothetical protein